MSDEESEKQRGQRTSDVPVDLTRERETFVRQFLRKGVELTETVLEENKTLHDKLNAAQREIAMLRAQVASDDAIRDLIKKIDSLESERNKLLEKSTELEETTRQKETRNVEVEQELHDLANLYIASSHLHSTLSVRGVVKHLKELLQQLVGADIYAIYLMDGDGEVAHPDEVHRPPELPTYWHRRPLTQALSQREREKLVATQPRQASSHWL